MCKAKGAKLADRENTVVSLCDNWSYWRQGENWTLARRVLVLGIFTHAQSGVAKFAMFSWATKRCGGQERKDRLGAGRDRGTECREGRANGRLGRIRGCRR